MPRSGGTERVEKALARAREVLDIFASERVVKGIWGSPAGKTHLARRIVAEIPKHRVYVEPFAGGAQVLFTKEPSEVEVLSDLDPEIAFAFKFAKHITPEQIERLRRKRWVGDKALFRKLYESEPPDDDLERFYRLAYLVRFSFNKLRRGTMPDKNVGVEARFVDKLERNAPRLKDVRVCCADYQHVIDGLQRQSRYCNTVVSQVLEPRCIHLHPLDSLHLHTQPELLHVLG